MLAIEVDGSSHEGKYEYDLQRQKRLESFGVIFIRFENIDVKRNMKDVIRSLINVITEIEKSKELNTP